MEDEEVINDNSIASKMRDFYLSLETSDNLKIASSLTNVENHKPLCNHGEDAETVNEIMKDCRKKTIQNIKLPLAEKVRNLISTARKKITAKTSTDIGSASKHNQRHILSLIELLGTWSNYITELINVGFSIPVIISIICPLHLRIKEMIIEIFQQFQSDKNLIQLQQKLLLYNTNKQTTTTTTTTSTTTDPNNKSVSNGNNIYDQQFIPIPINTLDIIIIQIVTFRETIYHYYRFLKDILLSPYYHYQHEQQQLLQHQQQLQLQTIDNSIPTLDNEINNEIDSITNVGNNTCSNELLEKACDSIHTNNGNNTTNTHIPPSFIQFMELSDMNTIMNILYENNTIWREIESFYISLEYGYIQLSHIDALKCTSLLEIQTDVFIPQNIEDIHFILKKIIERSFSTYIESIVFAIGSKIIELLDNLHDSIIYSILSHKRWYIRSYRHRQITLPSSLLNTYDSTLIQSSDTRTSLSAGGSTTTLDNITNANKTPPQSSSGISTSLNQPPNSGNSPALSLESMSVWLLQSIQNSLEDDEEIDAYGVITTNTTTTHNNSNGSANTNSGTAMMMNTMSTQDDDDNIDGSKSPKALVIEDACIYLTTLCTHVQAMKSIINMYQNQMQYQSHIQYEYNLLHQVYSTSTCTSTSTTQTAATVDSAVTPCATSSSQGSTLSQQNTINTPSSSKPTSKSAPTSQYNLQPANQLLGLILPEFNRVLKSYQDILYSEINQLINRIVRKDITPVFTMYFNNRSFDIDGDTMERWIGEEILYTTISSLFYIDTNMNITSSSSGGVRVNGSSNSNHGVYSHSNSSRNIVGIGENDRYSDTLLYQCKIRLSTEMYQELIYHLVEKIVKELFSILMLKKYSEWGALYIQHEIRKIALLFEELTADTIGSESILTSSITSSLQTESSSHSTRTPADTTSSDISTPTNNNNINQISTISQGIYMRSIRNLFTPLIWYGILIILDQPGALWQYILPKAFFHETTVREILSCRIEFTPLAIEKAKIILQ